MYRVTTISHTIADDSNLSQPTMHQVTLTDARDKERFQTRLQVTPSDSEIEVGIGVVDTSYSIWLSADYPIQVKFHSSDTPIQLRSNNVRTVPLGAPSPASCVFFFTGSVANIWVSPIVGATQTATVDIDVTGDPNDAHT